MPLDDETKAELRRSARGYMERQTAAEDVPSRIRELRMNIERLEGRDGEPAETRAQNEYELEQLLKRAEFEELPTEIPDADQPSEEGEAE